MPNIIYVCELCDTAYPLEVGAVACEQRHKNEGHELGYCPLCGIERQFKKGDEGFQCLFCPCKLNALIDITVNHKEYLEEMQTKYKRFVLFNDWLMNKGRLRRVDPTKDEDENENVQEIPKRI